MFFEDFKIGMQVNIPSVTIKKSDMVEFALRYDNIPLHTDEEYAKNTVFGALIAPGVMSFMSVWVKYLEVDMIGNELIAGKSTKIEWFKPVYAGDTLTGNAVISNLTLRKPKNGIVEITIDVYNQNNEFVLSNVTQAVVKCR